MQKHRNFFHIFNQALTRRIAGILLTLNLVACMPVTAGDVPSLELVEIAPGIHVHQGRHVSIEDPGRGDIANIGFIVGERCVAVVDTGGRALTPSCSAVGSRAPRIDPEPADQGRDPGRHEPLDGPTIGQPLPEVAAGQRSPRQIALITLNHFPTASSSSSHDAASSQ